MSARTLHRNRRVRPLKRRRNEPCKSHPTVAGVGTQQPVADPEEFSIHFLSEMDFAGFFIAEETQFVQVNEQLATIFGYADPQTLCQQPPARLFGTRTWRRIYSSDRASMVRKLRKQDGSVLYCRLHVWRKEAGSGFLWYGLVADITEQKHLQERSKRFKRLFQSVNLAIGMVSPRGRIEAANRAMVAMLGYTSERELKSSTNVKQLAFNPTELERLQRLLQENGEVRDFIMGLRRRDGSPVVARVSVLPLDWSEGECITWQVSAEDITALFQAQAEINRLANFPQQNPNPILELSPRGEILFFNPAMKKLLNHFGLQEADIRRLLPSDFEMRCELLAAEEGGSDIVETHFRDRIFQWSFHYIPSEQVIHLYGMEITERKKMEQQLLHAQKMESIGTLAGGVAHDFNNLLMGILGTTSLLLSEMSPDSPYYSDIKNIQDAAQKAADLTRQLLSFSRRSHDSAQVVSVNEIVEETVNLFQRAGGRRVQVEVFPDRNLPGVEIEPAQLQQTIMNLLMNARDAVGAGGKIEVFTRQEKMHRMPADKQPHAGAYVVLEVRDNGSGIPPEQQQRIFEPFFTTKPQGEGTGLGLWLVYNYVQNAGGHIEVESEPGKGTRFYVYLPAVGLQEAGTGREEEPPIGGSETVLVVDDETALAEIARRMLSLHGYRVLTASSADDALRLFEENHGHIDVVLMDWTLPEKNGLELVQDLTRIDDRPQFVLTSGHLEPEQPDSASEAVTAFLPKPYSMSALLEAIRRALDRD